MKLKEIKLERFKRFTDTTITAIPENARLVIIAGPNGCGKSSLFEGLNIWSKRHTGYLNWDNTYFTKNPELGDLSHSNAVQISFHVEPTEPKKAIYIRSAYRNDPEFQIGSINRLGSMLDENRLGRMIENDAAVSKNYQRLTSQAFEDVFENESGSTTIADFREKVIGEIRAATSRLFPNLILNSLGNPLTDGTFKFDKGIAKGFLYKNLSGGEKAAFDLLLDVIVKRREYDNTIFCIDEPEAHMNTRLQGELLKELYDATGPECQLWLATHSIGMMRRARDMAAQYPGTIVFLDFGNRDFDVPQTIQPELPSRAFWQRVLDVAFDDFAALVAPSEVVLCEGSRIGSGGQAAGVDAKIYEAIFGDEFPDTCFIPVGNAHDVESDKLALIEAMQTLVSGTRVRRLRDRDDMSEAEVAEKSESGIAVLNRRNIESYLFDDEVIRALAAVHGRSEIAESLIQFKNEEMQKAAKTRGRPVDDVKASAGPIMSELKRQLSLTQCGNTVKEFMRVTLAPLLNNSLPVYVELRASVFPVLT
jgi:predicted ATPase